MFLALGAVFLNGHQLSYRAASVAPRTKSMRGPLVVKECDRLILNVRETKFVLLTMFLFLKGPRLSKCYQVNGQQVEIKNNLSVPQRSCLGVDALRHL